MTYRTVRQMENAIINRIVKDALAAGYAISVDDGERICVIQSTDKQEIIDGLGSVDDEHIIFFKDGQETGRVYLVYGNDGHDVICDFSGNDATAAVLAGAAALADSYASE